MNEIDFPIDQIPAEIKALGRTVADRVAGPGVIEDIAVFIDVDSWDRVVYRFDFLLDPARLGISLGELHSGLRRHLSNALHELKDPRYPIVRLAERADWAKLGHA